MSENRLSEGETHIMSNDLDMEQNDACVEDNSEELTNTTDAEVEGEAMNLMALTMPKPCQLNDKIIRHIKEGILFLDYTPYFPGYLCVLQPKKGFYNLRA